MKNRLSQLDLQHLDVYQERPEFSSSIYPTLKVLMRAREIAGITRLSNLTTLDSILIPTWQAVRPLSRNMIVSQGKGLSHPEAMISALAESMELSCAEAPAWDVWATPEEIRPTLPYDFFDLPGLALTDAQFMILSRKWTAALELTTHMWTYVPTELVTIDFCAAVGDPPMFTPSSNGLASGTTPSRALLHGVLEVIERDTLARVQRGIESSREVRTSDAFSSELSLLTSNIERYGSKLILRYLKSRFGIPVFEAEISHPDFGTFTGSAAHLNRDKAAIGAITEAAQSRITAISGARDDITDRTYAVRNRGFSMPQPMFRRPHALNFVDMADIPSMPVSTCTAELCHCLTTLRSMNLRCLAADIGSIYKGYYVCFIIIPQTLRTFGHA